MDGDYYERELVNRLRLDGYAVLRAPSSGSATKAELPDWTALKKWYNRSFGGYTHHIWAGESKASADDLIYLSEEEVDALCSFASDGGYSAYLAGRWKGDPNHYLIRPANCYRIDGDAGNYRLKRPESPDQWPGRVIPKHPNE